MQRIRRKEIIYSLIKLIFIKHLLLDIEDTAVIYGT